MQNNTYKNQSVNISRVMVLPKGLKKVGEFSLDLSRGEEEKSKDLTRALFAHQDEIFNELSRAGIFVSARQKTSDFSQKSKDVVIIFPVIIGVSVKGNFVIISVYEKNLGRS